jgi:hypothetical protein
MQGGLHFQRAPRRAPRYYFNLVIIGPQHNHGIARKLEDVAAVASNNPIQLPEVRVERFF